LPFVPFLFEENFALLNLCACKWYNRQNRKSGLAARALIAVLAGKPNKIEWMYLLEVHCHLRLAGEDVVINLADPPFPIQLQQPWRGSHDRPFAS